MKPRKERQARQGGHSLHEVLQYRLPTWPRTPRVGLHFPPLERSSKKALKSEHQEKAVQSGYTTVSDCEAEVDTKELWSNKNRGNDDTSPGDHNGCI